MKMTMPNLQGAGGSSRADEIGNRYGLMKPPELTPEIASRRWRELNRLIHACMVLHGVGADRRPFQRLLRTAGALVGAARGIFYVRCDSESALDMAASSGFLRGVPERLRSGSELAGCSGKGPDEDPNTSLFKIDIIQVPLASPQDARIVASPRLFADSSGNIAGLWEGGNHGEGTQTTTVTGAAFAHGWCRAAAG